MHTAPILTTVHTEVEIGSDSEEGGHSPRDASTVDHAEDALDDGGRDARTVRWQTREDKGSAMRCGPAAGRESREKQATGQEQRPALGDLPWSRPCRSLADRLGQSGVQYRSAISPPVQTPLSANQRTSFSWEYYSNPLGGSRELFTVSSGSRRWSLRRTPGGSESVQRRSQTNMTNEHT